MTDQELEKRREELLQLYSKSRSQRENATPLDVVHAVSFESEKYRQAMRLADEREAHGSYYVAARLRNKARDYLRFSMYLGAEDDSPMPIPEQAYSDVVAFETNNTKAESFHGSRHTLTWFGFGRGFGGKAQDAYSKGIYRLDHSDTVWVDGVRWQGLVEFNAVDKTYHASLNGISQSLDGGLAHYAPYPLYSHADAIAWCEREIQAMMDGLRASDEVTYLKEVMMA